MKKRDGLFVFLMGLLGQILLVSGLFAGMTLILKVKDIDLKGLIALGTLVTAGLSLTLIYAPIAPIKILKLTRRIRRAIWAGSLFFGASMLSTYLSILPKNPSWTWPQFIFVAAMFSVAAMICMLMLDLAGHIGEKLEPKFLAWFRKPSS